MAAPPDPYHCRTTPFSVVQHPVPAFISNTLIHTPRIRCRRFKRTHFPSIFNLPLTPPTSRNLLPLSSSLPLGQDLTPLHQPPPSTEKTPVTPPMPKTPPQAHTLLSTTDQSPARPTHRQVEEGGMTGGARQAGGGSEDVGFYCDGGGWM